MQSCLKSMHGIDLSLGRIAGIIKEAGSRAHNCWEQHLATTPRAPARDEQDRSPRGEASLHVIAVHCGHVWASVRFPSGSGRRQLDPAFMVCAGTRDQPGAYGERCRPSHPAGVESGSGGRAMPMGGVVHLPSCCARAGTPGSNRENRAEIHLCSKHIRRALPLTLLFARHLDAIQVRPRVPWDQRRSRCWHGHGCVGRCWVRRIHVLLGLDPAWRAIASGLLHAWDQAVRASRSVEHWQCIVRPHVAVHRTFRQVSSP